MLPSKAAHQNENPLSLMTVSAKQHNKS